MASNELVMIVQFSKALTDRIQKLIDQALDDGPYCPFCRTKLIRIHIECHDGSGWMHGWTCNCPESETK